MLFNNQKGGNRFRKAKDEILGKPFQRDCFKGRV